MTRNYVIVCATALVISFFAWPGRFHYENMNYGRLLRSDWITGETQWLELDHLDDGWHPAHKLVSIPRPLLSKLTGTAAFEQTAFRIELYNPTDWTIRELTIEILPVDGNGAPWPNESTQPRRFTRAPTSFGPHSVYVDSFPLGENDSLTAAMANPFLRDLPPPNGPASKWSVINGKGYLSE